MARATVIRKVAWAIAWDAGLGRHHYLRDVDLAFADDRIRFLGRSYAGAVDEEIDGRALLVMPGLVNVHSHPTGQPLYKGIREELGNRYLRGTALYDFVGLFQPDDEARRAATAYALCELLQSGVTTFADLSMPYDGWLDLLARSGIRAFVAPMYRSAAWRVREGRRLEYEWDESAGRKSFEAALALMAAAERHPSGRLAGMLAPAQIDTCTEGLLRDSAEAARASGRPLQVHAAQTAVEVEEMTRRHDKTPIQWAHAIGLLGPGTTIGHAVFIDRHPAIRWPTRRDLDILASSGSSVAHCPTVFSRYGHTLRSFGDYRRAGVNIGLGTDTFPHNMIEEIRAAIILGRVAGESMESVSTADAFHAATAGGARVLMRDDIGRLAPGMKADLVLVDLRHPLMRPARDPLRSLVYTAAERAVRDVFVDGRQVVRQGRALTLDMEEAAALVEDAQRRIEAGVPGRDDLGRRAEEVAPLSLPLG